MGGWLFQVAPTFPSAPVPSLFQCPPVPLVSSSNHWAFSSQALPLQRFHQPDMDGTGTGPPPAIPKGIPMDPSPQWDPQMSLCSPWGTHYLVGVGDGFRRSLDCRVHAGGSLWDL